MQTPRSSPTKLHITYLEWDLGGRGKEVPGVGYTRLSWGQNCHTEIWNYVCWMLRSLKPFFLLAPRGQEAKPLSSRKDTGRTRSKRNTWYWMLLSLTTQTDYTTASLVDSSFNDSYAAIFLSLQCYYKKPTQPHYFNHVVALCPHSCSLYILSAVVRVNF